MSTLLGDGPDYQLANGNVVGGALPTPTRLASPRSSLVLEGGSPGSGTDNQGTGLYGKGLGVEGGSLLFPGHLPPSSLSQWIGHSTVAALEKAHPNPYKKHKHPSISGHAHKGKQGAPWLGVGICVPAALTQ